MKKIYMLLLLAVFCFFPRMAVANPISATTIPWKINIPDLEVPPLIITEFRGDVNNRYYLELTNVGDETIDLSEFSVISGHTYTKMEGSTDSMVYLAHLFNYVPLKGTLEPGQSYVEISVFDVNFQGSGLPRHHIGLLDVADRIYHQPETTVLPENFLNKPEWYAYGRDSISDYYPMITMPGSSCYYLEYKFINAEGERDSTLVDNVNFAIDPGHNHGAWGKGPYNFPVAGVADPVRNNILVRKANIRQGNMDWHLSRGTDPQTSEWLVIPKFADQYDYFTTIGVHGDFSLDFQVKDPSTVIYEEANKLLMLPWNITKGERVNNLFDLGPGMAWKYTENANDSLYTNVRTGDVFSLYATGDQLEELHLTIMVQEPAPNVAAAFASRVYTSSIDNITGVESWSWSNRYRITQGLDMDSIYNIGYGTHVDTLLKYMYKPEKASWEIDFVEGKQRANLKRGDKLVVTSEDGSSVKEYLIQVNEYNPSGNAFSSAITWPDIDFDIYWQWTNDTVPGFDRTRGAYTIRLIEGTTAIPALRFKTEHLNSTVKVDRATHINGTIEQRTTTATVIAADGETTRTYSILFEVETVPIQPNIAEPFIAEMMLGHRFAYAIEIFNPGTEELDLSRYMLAAGFIDDNIDAVVNRFRTNDLRDIYQWHFVPGYRYKHDTDLDAFTLDPGWLVPDNVVNTIVGPGEVWTAGTTPDGSWPGGRFYPGNYVEGFTEGPYLDFVWYGYSEQIPDTHVTDEENAQFRMNPWGIDLHRYRHPLCLGINNTQRSLFLLKIMNDSIFEGTKRITDPNDYEIIDRFQKPLDIDEIHVSGYNMNVPHVQGWSLRRKSHVWRGVTERGGGLGDNGGQSAENSEWEVFNDRARPTHIANHNIWQELGSHVMDPITVYLSTVTSVQLQVTPGYEGNHLTITGDLTGLTVEIFKTLLDKADPGQVLEVMDGTEVLPSDAAIAAGMLLKVTSFDGRNTTSYTLVNSPLSGDNLLVAKAGSGLNVTLTGPKGVVDGVALDATIKGLLDMLEVPDKAVLNVIDAKNNLVPLTDLNYDTLSVDVMVGPNIYLEVVAENNNTAVYSLGFGTVSSDAILLSNILHIDQDMRLVSGVPAGFTPESLLSLVFASEGASIAVVDKFGAPRELNMRLNYDDEIIVTSEDGTAKATYKMQFAGLELVGNIMANVTFIINDPEAVFPEGFMLKGSWNTLTGEYDSGWHGGAEHTRFYDDGTHGDETAGDNIWTVTLSLAVDKGEHTWQWGFNNMEGRWLPSDTIQFKLEKAQDVVTTYTVVTTNIPVIEGESFRVYPNPASSELMIDGIDLQSARSVQIINIIGQHQVVRMTGSNRISVSNLEPGLYVLRIIEPNGHMSTVRFMKK